MKLQTILLFGLSAVFFTVGTILLLGELEQFEPILFLLLKVVGFIFIAAGIYTFPLQLNLSFEEEELQEVLVSAFCICTLIGFITFYIIFKIQ